MSVYRPKYDEYATDPKSGAKARTGRKIESAVWWCKFTYMRRVIRESTRQTKKTLAKEYEKRRRRELENAVAGVSESKPGHRIKDLKTVIENWQVLRTAGQKEKSQGLHRTAV